MFVLWKKFQNCGNHSIEIGKENLGKVFEPFYTTKEASDGSSIDGMGFGLSVSYGIVKKHGGTVKVEGKPRKGTLFTVKLTLKGSGSK
ncbi:MAG: ATP-binding protein [Candidatus Aminicenantes bacterium]